MDLNSLQWAEFTKDVGQEIPDWIRLAAIDPQGEAYLPLGIATGEMFAHVAAVAAASDGIEVLQTLDHYYAPASWMRQRFPDLAGVIDQAHQAVRQHFGYTAKEAGK